MPEEVQRQQDEVELQAGDKKIKVRGSDFLGIMTLIGVTVFGYILFDHKMDANNTSVAVVQAVKEMTAAQRENTIAQRVMNCLISIDQKDRSAQVSTCERIAR